MRATVAVLVFWICLLLPAEPGQATELKLPLLLCDKAAQGDVCVEPLDVVFSATPTPATQMHVIERFRSEPWAADGELPEIGLALSGGGSKAAPFAMGVLKRFADRDWLDRTDLLSSVSGGGYAAYYLYSHAWMRATYPETMMERRTLNATSDTLPRIKDFFADARQEQYGDWIEVNGEDSGFRRMVVWTPDELRYGRLRGPKDCYSYENNSRRHQAFVECYQDILSRDPGGLSTNLDRPPYGAYTSTALQTIGLWPAHHVANSLFDWKVGLAPSRWAYRTGIARTYGTLPVGDAATPDIESKDDFTFSGLRDLYQDKETPVPWWIINSTNDVSGSEDKTRLGLTVFEMTPTSFGSGTYGFVSGAGIDSIKPLTPLDAVAAAGAFFDSLSARQPGGAPEWLIFGGLHMLNARWGYELPNYQVSDAQRRLHAFLPWPLYYAHGFARTAKSNHIRIADGGMSGDNLGVYSLLRRGTRHIVVADGALDLDKESRTSSIPELCVLSRTLVEAGFDIHFDKWPDGTVMQAPQPLHAICDTETSQVRDDYRPHFNPYAWKLPVWTGVVSALSHDVPESVLSGIRVYYLKAAIDVDAMQKAIADWRDDPLVCNGSNGQLGSNYAAYGLPCGLVGYAIDAGPYREPGAWVWPQTNTVGDTANSSSNKFKAYRDLGWYAAGLLSCETQSPFHDASACAEASGRQVPTPSER
ncbi:patatin-like phospholipase family protein [Stenotrophomonas sp. GZD-301]|uniref:patatin-like phospholipase family protein n=1 Tax=Stenotrophomonas sp. GZD-301 TaxID=3404814 RepID=UPI003BB7C555